MHRSGMLSARGEYVFPDDKGKMRSRQTKLRTVMARALKRAELVAGYTHVCRRKGCGHREETKDRDLRRGALNIAPMLEQNMAAAAEKAGMPKLKLPDLFLQPADPLFPLKPGTDLFLDSPDREPSNLQFAFKVAFGEPQVLQGAPVIETLSGMTRMVEDILATFAPKP